MLRLAVTAQVLVAVGVRELVVAVVAGDHQQLLQLLGRLRQREELAGAQSRRHDEVARPLRRRLDQRRRLDLDEALVLERAADAAGQPRAQEHPLLHRRPPQVEIPMLQAEALVEPRLLLVDVERRNLRWVQDLEPIDRDLDLAGRELGVRRALRPMPDGALDLHDPFVARRFGSLVRFLALFGARHHLGDAVAVAQVEEREVPVVPAPMHPSRERHALADMLGAQLATGMTSEGGAHGSSIVAEPGAWLPLLELRAPLW